MKTAFITGISGQDGSYLAELLLEKGYRVIGLKRRTSSEGTERIRHLLDDPNFILKPYDLADSSSLGTLLMAEKPHEFYNLASQSHVGTSFEMPEYTTESICIGTLKILEAIRSFSPATKFFQASSSEMYGTNQGDDGLSEWDEFEPISPYAAAKVFSHHMTGIYRQAYGLWACAGILFNHESPRRSLAFVTRKITHTAAKIKMGMADKLVLGNIDVYKDWGFAPDYVQAMWLMLQSSEAADYVVATGIVHSIRDFVKTVFKIAELRDYTKYVVIDPKLFRPNDVGVLRGNSTNIRIDLKWQPSKTMEEVAALMYEADLAALKERN